MFSSQFSTSFKLFNINSAEVCVTFAYSYESRIYYNRFGAVCQVDLEIFYLLYKCMTFSNLPFRSVLFLLHIVWGAVGLFFDIIHIDFLFTIC